MYLFSGNTECGRANIDFYTDSDPCVTNNIGKNIKKKMIELRKGVIICFALKGRGV